MIEVVVVVLLLVVVVVVVVVVFALVIVVIKAVIIVVIIIVVVVVVVVVNIICMLSESRDQKFFDHIKSFEQSPDFHDESNPVGYGGTSTPYIPPGMLNYNLPWRKENEFPDPTSEVFISDTDSDKFRFDQ